MDIQKEKTAIQRLKSFAPEGEPYYLCYSGGKDGDCIKILAALAGVKHENVHNLTTVDAPETIRYIQSQPDVRIDPPPMIEFNGKMIQATMWRLIEKKLIPPTRLMRYCCSTFKEPGGKGRLKITGVRWAESNNRKENADLVRIIGKPKTNQKFADEIGADYRVTKFGGMILNIDNSESRRMVEQCYRTSSTMINPIIDWTDSDVWGFLRHYGCSSNPLYHITGCNRIGCVGCPLSSNMQAEFARYPIYKQNYIRAFDRMLAARIAAGKSVDERWKDGEHVMAWWLGENIDQLTFFDEEDNHGD